jgi:hypothetical protein
MELAQPDTLSIPVGWIIYATQYKYLAAIYIARVEQFYEKAEH